MKFALQLSENLVPEWRDQYLDYKGGKKRLKKIGKNSAKAPLVDSPGPFSSLLGFSAGARERAKSIVKPSPVRTVTGNPTSLIPSDPSSVTPLDFTNTLSGFSLPPPATSGSKPAVENIVANDKAKKITYAPSSSQTLLFENNSNNLPGKRLPNQNDTSDVVEITEHSPLLNPKMYNPRPVQYSSTDHPFGSGIRRSSTLKKIVNKISGSDSAKSPGTASKFSSNIDTPQFDTMYTKDEQEFVDWLDMEFTKIETFYKKKENDSIERYLILQDQLFNLREQKHIQKAHQEKRAAAIQALYNKKRSERETTGAAVAATKNITEGIANKLNRKFDLPSLPASLRTKLFGKNAADDDTLINCIHNPDEQKLETALSATGALTGPVEQESSSDASSIVSVPAASISHRHSATAAGGSYLRRQTLGTNESPVLAKTVNDIQTPEEHGVLAKGHKKDYTKRIRDQSISYGVARRQLKLAVVELYRELEMLKSYRSLNQTAFRKMIKKFDKVTGHNTQPNFMAKVKRSYFSQSELLDDLIRKTEDMFAVYFEGGNHKHAVEKLRANTVNELHYTEMFLTGIFLGLTVPIAVRATYKGVTEIHNGNPDALFLFQIWGGFFLIVLFFCLFAINCIVWTMYKVNYSFVFEFNPLHHLQATQVGSVPAFLLFMLSLIAWFCYEDFWPEKLPQIYYPLIFLGIILAVLFWPYHGFHFHARKWLHAAFWRVFFSGFYPVEFRDLIMGDISSSLTYAISNTAFFFCLYATHWNGLFPGSTSGSQCGSSHSRWMGFLSSLPGIWRFLQCGRRYLDSGDAFPHVANMGKYGVNISYNAFLSAYRMDLSSTTYRSLFIFFASLNTMYSGFWDLFMDWSVMQFTSKNFLLRDELAFKSKTPYYIAMVLDPLLRCNWIFYAIYANQVQQSAKVSFFVALAELLRRFLWVFFRVENEHCSNVLRFRASRDITLPYTVVRRKLGFKNERDQVDGEMGSTENDGQAPQHLNDEESRIGHESAGEAILLQPSDTYPYTSATSKNATSFSSRFYRFISPALHAAGTTLQSAHVRDFERRKDKPREPSGRVSIDSDDEEEDEEEEFYDNMSQLSGHSGRGGKQAPRSIQEMEASILESQGAVGSSGNRPRHHSDLETNETRKWRDRYL